MRVTETIREHIEEFKRKNEHEILCDNRTALLMLTSMQNCLAIASDLEGPNPSEINVHYNSAGEVFVDCNGTKLRLANTSDGLRLTSNSDIKLSQVNGLGALIFKGGNQDELY